MNLFAHVGFQKTGSTLLQDCLFNRHPQIHYAGPVNKQSATDELRGIPDFLSGGVIPAGGADFTRLDEQRINKMPKSMPV